MNFNFLYRKIHRVSRMSVDSFGHMLIKDYNSSCSFSRKARIAFVKQDCYQDLWIGSENETYQDLILSTQMRIGPIGLITHCNCKFFIVQFNPSNDGTDYFKHQSYLSDCDIKVVKEFRAEKISEYLSSESIKLHADYSQPVENIDWSIFDVVICINSPISHRIRKCYPDILWACMPGEGLCRDDKLHQLNYDCYLTHNWASMAVPYKGIYVDFPYTFLGPDDLMKVDGLTDSFDKEGIYLEINSGTKQERPPSLSSIPDAITLHANTGLKIKVHKGTINAHLTDLIASKYFIKLGGRPTRGNAFMEAISAHSLILMRRGDCFGNMTLPMDSYFTDIDDLSAKILYLETNFDFYQSLLEEQKQCLFKYGISLPLQQLAYVYNTKSKLSFLFVKELELLRLVLLSLWNRFTQKVQTKANIGLKTNLNRNS